MGWFERVLALSKACSYTEQRFKPEAEFGSDLLQVNISKMSSYKMVVLFLILLIHSSVSFQHQSNSTHILRIVNYRRITESVGTPVKAYYRVVLQIISPYIYWLKKIKVVTEWSKA
jgi:hypothetical protein